MPDTPSVPLAGLVGLFTGLLFLGTLICLPLFGFSWHRLRTSRLWTKIWLWVPIFGVFVLALYLPGPGRLAIVAILLGAAWREAWAKQRQDRVALVYYAGFALAFSQFYGLGLIYPELATTLLITICFGSALSDVTAYFCGNYLGRHKLPAVLNARKSWEGVVGQIGGASLGVALVHLVGTPVLSPWIWLPIGLGAATGDLANSYFKRRLNIKDWSEAIPGHGGYLDRLSSLAGSAAATMVWLALTR